VKIPTFAVLPSNGRDCMRDCFDSLAGQVDHLFLVRNADFRPPPSLGPHRMTVLDYFSDKKLPIHEWYNLGIDAAAQRAADMCCSKWNTLICCDDVVAEPDAVGVLASALRDSPAALACPYRPEAHHSANLLLTEGNVYAGPGMWISGWFFMLRGEAGLHADTNLYWWYGDNDLEWQARYAGGALLVRGCNVVNRFPGGHDGVMAEEIKLDGVYFAQKWPQAAAQPR
jgi:hypothetical protein